MAVACRPLSASPLLPATAIKTVAAPTSIPLALPTRRTPAPAASATPIPALIPTPTLTPPPTATPTPPVPYTIHHLGVSSLGYPIEAWQLGQGAQAVILVGGMHGGYEWNTILLAYAMIDYFEAHAAEIPASIALFIIPAVNLDGQALVTGQSGRFSPADVTGDAEAGRFNAQGVDLNRNWDCQWTEQAYWRDQTVWAGSAPFSESETLALRDFILAVQPRLTLFWHSAADGVYLARCDGVEAPDTRRLASVYAEAAGYAVQSAFVYYPITGDASDYLNRLGLTSFSVELPDHTGLDWEANLAAVKALLAAVAESGP